MDISETAMEAKAERKSVISEAIDLKLALEDILGMVREQSAINKEAMPSVPQSSLKLDNLKNTILDCRSLTNQINKALSLLV